MIDYETFCQIKELKNNKGLNAEQIAREMCLEQPDGSKMGLGRSLQAQKISPAAQ